MTSQVSHIELHTHEMTCGSESATCHICNRTVMKRLLPRHLASNCEFPNPAAPPEELFQLAIEESAAGGTGGIGDGDGDGDGNGDGAAEDAAVTENMSRTGKEDAFLTAISDSDEDDDGNDHSVRVHWDYMYLYKYIYIYWRAVMII